MPRPIRSIDVYLPVEYNDGQPIEDAKFVDIQRELVNRFGGLTSTHREFPLQGMWRHDRRVFQDKVMIFSALDYRAGVQLETYRYLERLKVKLKRRFRQLDILITVQEMVAI